MADRRHTVGADARALINRGESVFGPMRITSGHRSHAYNASIGGARNSDHLTGNAFDISVRGMSSSRQAQIADYYRSQPGVYVKDEPHGTGPHIHVSYRGEKGASAAKGDVDPNGKQSNRSDNSQSDKLGNPNTDEENKKKSESGDAQKPHDHDGILPGGSVNNYQQGKTGSIGSRLPTHEPWPYHPKGQLGPRQGVEGSGQSGGPSTGGTNADPSNTGATDNPGAASGGGASNKEIESYIREAATKRGIDPNVAVQVFRKEGAGGRGPSRAGDIRQGVATSFGPYQLHYGGLTPGNRGMNEGGLGDVFTKQTGLNARDPSTWRQQVDFSLDQAAKGGWGPWHGWKGGSRAGLDGAKPAGITPFTPGAANNGAPKRADEGMNPEATGGGNASLPGTGPGSNAPTAGGGGGGGGGDAGGGGGGGGSAPTTSATPAPLIRSPFQHRSNTPAPYGAGGAQNVGTSPAPTTPRTKARPAMKVGTNDSGSGPSGYGPGF